MLKKFIVITTINSYENTSIEKFKAYGNIIVVGDLKTPHESYKFKNIIYIHPKETLYFDKFIKLLPYNHYSRKNIGYLYAIKNNADKIFDTDDDNYPLDNFNDWQNNIDFKYIIAPKYPNIYSLYSNLHIWSRGYPLELVNKKKKIKLSDPNEDTIQKIGIYQSLVKGDPDVDAICRLTNDNYKNNIKFCENKAYIVKKNIFVQGNTQATLWNDSKLFHLLYIPTTVSFRFCDILKMYIAQKCMWAYNKILCYISPIVVQYRNEHNFMNDFKSEYPMYISIFHIIDNIFQDINLNGTIDDLILIYKRLIKENIVKEQELKLVEEWLNAIKMLC